MLIKHSHTKRFSYVNIASALLGFSWCFLHIACNDEYKIIDDHAGTWQSTLRGHYQVSIYPSNPPIKLGQIHSWIVEFRDSDNLPTTPDHISVSGGMPSHKHGLSTTPRVTEMLNEGRFRIDGVKFHMPGDWVLNLGITGPPGQDILQLDLLVEP